MGLEKYLDITPGSVSVMGLMNDKENNVIRLKIDSKKVSVSDVATAYAQVCEIKDINVITDNIDDIIYKLYEEFNI